MSDAHRQVTVTLDAPEAKVLTYALPTPGDTLLYQRSNEFPLAADMDYRMVRLDHLIDEPPRVRLTVWLSDATIAPGRPDRPVALVRLRDDVAPSGFLEVFRRAHDPWALQEDACWAGAEDEQAKLDAKVLVEAQDINSSLAVVARRCSTCEVHEIRGGEAQPQWITVRTYEVSLVIVPGLAGNDE